MLGLVPVVFALAGESLGLPLSLRVTAPVGPVPKDRVVVHVSVLRESTEGPSVASKDMFMTNGEGRTELRVPPGQYIIRTEAAGFWAPDYPAHIASGTLPTAEVRMWPTNALMFDLRTETHEPPKELAIDFRGVPTVEEKIRVPAGFTTCKVLERRATCAVPAGRIDFRVMSIPPAPFIPEYFWDVENRGGERASLRSLSLVSGSSLIGYVRNENGEPAVGVNVDLKTPGGSEIPPSATTVGGVRANVPPRERRQSRLHATTNDRGFFQIRQAVPGEYRIVATDDSGASAHRTVTLDSERETALRDFLPLERPYQLEVAIDPPVPPDGDLWSIELVRITPLTSMLRYAVDYGGKAILDGVGRGQYNISVLSGRQKYFLEAFEVEEQPGPMQIKIPLLAVRGRITLGDKPLRATLIFGGDRGPRSVALESSETGEFKGVLPRQGDWIVQIEASDPPVHRRLWRVSVVAGISQEAEVNIQLKSARLKGRVVDETDSLVTDALITATPIASPEDSPTTFRVQTGLFDLAGMSPGMVALEAQTPDQRSSEPVAVTLGESEVDVTLVVSKPIELTGRVLSSASSQPIPGALLVAMAANKPLTGVGMQRTDEEGRFKLRLPPHTVVTNVAYWADGYSLDMTRAAVRANAEVILLASAIGGTLTVTLPGADEMKGSVPVIVRGGAAMPAGGLASLRPEDRRLTLEPASSPVVIPNLAPGEYALCSMDANGFQLGLSPKVGSNCSYGVLPPGGELALSLSMNRNQASR